MPQRQRNAASFTVSGCFHGSVLAWLMFGSVGAHERQPSLYEQVIQPNEKKIVWYRLSEKLPEIAPVAAADPRPLRARVNSPQTMVAGATDDVKLEPLIRMPDPPVIPPKPAALPNVIAVADPPLVAPRPVVPEVPIEMKSPKPAPRAFVPPPEIRMARQAPLQLPEAPMAREMVVEANALPLAPTGLRPRPRDFVPPPKKVSSADPVSLAAAPDVTSAPVTAVALPKTFAIPPAKPVDRSTPTVSADAPLIHAPPTADATMAIVGLNPANTREIPPPPPSRPAAFSAGPVLRKDGSSESADGSAVVNVPGLTVKGGPKDAAPTLAGIFSPTSRETLLAAARTVGGVPTVPPPEPRAARVSNAPDPSLAGRVIYTIAIQMPNVTSFSGSWLVWFAEREPLAGSAAVDVKPPVPLRKVDPKYVVTAMDERVEGTVRLGAVIRKDGHVDGISLIRHLDARLDATSQEALAKWQFTPALRNGIAVDVDAVFEIPFRLAPRSTK